MTGTVGPTDEEMRAKLAKRLYIVGQGIPALKKSTTREEKRKFTVGKVDAELTRIRGGATLPAGVIVAHGSFYRTSILSTLA